MVDQTNTFQVYHVSPTLQHFYFDQQSEKDSPSIPENRIFFLLIGVLLMSAKSLLAMVWTIDMSQTGLIKTKNYSTKISFITKLDIYI